MGLKQSLKKILVEKQHIKYEAELSEKKMSYEDWILKQEETVKVDNLLCLNLLNCLKNEKMKNINDGSKNKNEGFLSKNDVFTDAWEVFDKTGANAEKLTVDVFSFADMSKNVCDKLITYLKACEKDIVLFRREDSELSSLTFPLLYEKFSKNKNIILIYGDEDVKKDGHREKPWLKPDWSPDTFLSQFYFGSLVAIRTEEIKRALKEVQEKMYIQADEAQTDETEIIEGQTNSFLYMLCEAVIRNAGGFTMHKELLLEEPVCHIPEILVHTKEEGYLAVKDWKLSGSEQLVEDLERAQERKSKQKLQQAEKPLISVIIPSKDNPDVLFNCIHSFIERTVTEYSYEILVIDNGSRDENKEKIQAETQRLNLEAARNVLMGQPVFRGIAYHYEPMVFNFSRMCNLGVSFCHGELVLFLNDDMEIIQKNWLTMLADKTMLSYVGAVGAKLLYPDSNIIQHAGITNLRVGPAHKLQFLSDGEEHYYGKNRGVHNMLAATGACLMMRREVFNQVGGFAQELAVAFNDVDLCYSIYEAGYYNMVRNDVRLYHHESLSRGKDGESEEKQLRLLREKDVLYERHQEIYGKDPFYHKYLTTDMLESEYSPAVRYQVTLDMPWAKVKKESGLPDNVREDGCVVIGMEAAMDIYKWIYGVDPGKGKIEPLPEEMGYYFQGYSFVIGSDNACYKKTLLLENKGNGQIIKVPLDIRYRPDIRKNLKDQLNVDLTGYAAKVRLADIPKGEYRFGMLAEDKCSRLKLVNWSSWVLQV